MHCLECAPDIYLLTSEIQPKRHPESQAEMYPPTPVLAPMVPGSPQVTT
jgi:hypothetical protein